MPANNIDYTKTIIYKICCNDLNVTNIYVGSTCNFIKRKSQHKTSCLNINSKEYNYKLYQFIRDNGNWINFSMIEIEKYPCNDNNEKRARERYWYEQLNSNLNMVKPIQTIEERKQYYIENKDKIKESQQVYYEKIKEAFNENRREKITCVCGAIIAKGYKSSHEKTFTHISKTQSLFSS